MGQLAAPEKANRGGCLATYWALAVPARPQSKAQRTRYVFIRDVALINLLLLKARAVKCRSPLESIEETQAIPSKKLS
jgi:hypothetical protein